MKKSLPFIIIAIVLVAGIVAFVMFSQKKGTDSNNSLFSNSAQNSTTTAPPANQASPTATIPITKPNVKVSSPVMVEEYGDYQCPPCGALFPVLKSIESEYGDQVRFVFHHFPLTSMHKNALVASRAAEAARNQGKFWEMHDQLYRNQNSWKDLDDPRAVFLGYARALGMNADRFAGDLESTAVEQRIADDMRRGSAAGVTGTPTVFIEGRMLRYEATTPEGIRQGINFMLQKKAVS
jgi:protein-disulfide isomerase